MVKILFLLLAFSFQTFGAVSASSSITGKGGGSASPLTTKGDVWTYSTTDARLPVGANGLVLTADSAEATGVKWGSVAGTGDVVGPASSVDFEACFFDGTTGKAIRAASTTGGTVGIAAGSVTAPSLALAPDIDGTGTGLYRVAANHIGFALNGVREMSINSAGNVMIGTTTAPDSGGNNLFISRGAAGNATGAGILRITDIETDTEVKQATISWPHQTNAEEDHAMLYGSDSTLYVGGGVSTLNAVTALNFYTGANDTTTSGTLRMSIDSSGVVNLSNLTASNLVFTDGSKNLVSKTLAQGLSGMVEDLHGYISSVSDATYVVMAKNRVARQVTKVALKCSGTSITAKLQIGGVDITTCTGISVTSTVSDTTCDTGSSNDLAAAGRLTLVTSSNSSCGNLEWSIETTRD